MKLKAAALVLASALALPAWGQAHCSDSARLGTILVRPGDSERRILDQRPSRTVRLETRQGGAAGFRHDFHLYRSTVQVYVRSGVVTQICHLREL